jgi:hypothetical protein
MLIPRMLPSNGPMPRYISVFCFQYESHGFNLMICGNMVMLNLLGNRSMYNLGETGDVEQMVEEGKVKQIFF